MSKTITDTNSLGKQSDIVTAVLEGGKFKTIAEGDFVSTPPIRIDLPFIDVKCPVCNTQSVALKRDLAKEGTVKCLICGHRYDPRNKGKND